MAPVMKERKHRPTRENRLESFLVTREDLASHAEQLAWPSLGEGFSRMPKERWFASAVTTVEDRWRAALIADALKVALPQADSIKLPEAFSSYYLCLLAEITRHHERRVLWSAPHDEFREAPWFMGVAASGGASDVCDRLAPYFWNVWRSGGANRAKWTDEALYTFFMHLVEADLTGIWPARIDDSVLREYAALLRSVGQPEEFRRVLVDCCDYRMAHAWMYDGIDAAKRYSASTTKSVFQMRNTAAILVPYELLYLKYVYEKITGATLSLDADHPMLQSENIVVPQVWPLAESDFGRELAVFLDREIGGTWRDPAPIVPIDIT